MAIDTARYANLYNAHEKAPHLFPKVNSARYARANQEKLGLKGVFLVQFGKIIIDLELAQQRFEEQNNVAQ